MSLLDQVVEERLDGGHFARHCRRRILSAAKVQHVACQVLIREIRPGTHGRQRHQVLCRVGFFSGGLCLCIALQEAQKLGQIIAVGKNGVDREPAFRLQHLEEIVNLVLHLALPRLFGDQGVFPGNAQT